MTDILTIGIAAHNEEKAIATLLNSVLENIFSMSEYDLFFEIVVATNGCTDKTEYIVEDFAKSHNILFRKEQVLPSSLNKLSSLSYSKNNISVTVLSIPQKGKSRAWNVIYNYSKGDKICFFDSDVIIPQDVVKILYKRLTEAPDIFAVSCNIQPIRINNNLVSWYFYLTEKISRSSPRTKISGPGYIMRKDPNVIKEIPEYMVHEDGFLYTWIGINDVPPYKNGLNKIMQENKAVIFHPSAKGYREFYRGKIRGHYSALQFNKFFGEKYPEIKEQIKGKLILNKKHIGQSLLWHEKPLYCFLRKVYPGPIVKFVHRLAQKKAKKLFWKGLSCQDIWPISRQWEKINRLRVK